MQSSPPVQVGAAPDGTLTYLVDLPPDALPAVRGRDLAAAWEAAHDAAGGKRRGAVRLFRFRDPEGAVTDLALADRDARAWAAAVDRLSGMGNCYGLSLCLRLLALVDLIAAARDGRFCKRGGRPSPAVFRAAAALPLSRAARFDETRLRARLPPAHTATSFPVAPGASR